MKGNTGECQVNVREWRKSASVTHGNAGEYRGIQGNSWGTYGVGAKCQGNAGECRGMPGERMGVGANCQGVAGGCRRMPGKHMGVSVKCQGNAGE